MKKIITVYNDEANSKTIAIFVDQIILMIPNADWTIIKFVNGETMGVHHQMDNLIEMIEGNNV